MELGIHVVTTNAPSILLDVDAARATPELLVRDLASQFAQDASDQRVMTIASNISAGGYKPV